MRDSLDEFVKNLQDSIDEDARKVYSEQVIENSMHPRNVGRMSAPDTAAKTTGLCGDTMEIYLMIKDDKISEAEFFSDGCGPTVACGSILTQMVKEKTIEETLKISPAALIEALNGLPEESLHCAILAVNTLHKAIADYLIRKQNQ